MRLGCSTLLASQRSLAETCRTIEALGFRYVDLDSLDHAGAPPDADSVSQALGRLTPLSLTSSRGAPEAFIRLAAALGAPVVTLPASGPATAIADEAAALAPLVSLGDSLGVQVTVQTQIGQLTESVAATVSLCEAVPGLGLTLDPAHYLAGPHQGREFGALYPYVRHVHVRDATREHVQVPFGQGQVPWASILMGLRSVGFDEGVTIAYTDSLPGEARVQSVRAAAHAVAAFWYG